MKRTEFDPDDTQPLYRLRLNNLTFLVHFPGEFLSEPERQVVLCLLQRKRLFEGAEALEITKDEYLSRLSRIKSRIEDKGLIRPETAYEIVSSLKSLNEIIIGRISRKPI